MLFARSGIELRKATTLAIELARRQTYADSEAGKEWQTLCSPSASSAPDFSLPATATVGSLINLARAVLVHTLNVKTLSLTGFLDLVMCGAHPTDVVLNEVLHVSLGPVPPRWFQPLHLDTFVECRQLRICGLMLHEDEVKDITEQLPCLNRLLWSVPTTYSWSPVSLRWVCALQ